MEWPVDHAAITCGDLDGVGDLVEEFLGTNIWRAIFRDFLRDFGNEADAWDALGAVCETLVRLVRVQTLRMPRAYIRKALNNRLKGRRYPAAQLISERLDWMSSQARDPLNMLIEQERAAGLVRLVAKLPAPIRAYVESGASTFSGFVEDHPEFGSYEGVRKSWQRSRERFYRIAVRERLF